MTTAFRACGKARAGVRYAAPLSRGARAGWMPDGGNMESSGGGGGSYGQQLAWRFTFSHGSIIATAGWMGALWHWHWEGCRGLVLFFAIE